MTAAARLVDRRSASHGEAGYARRPHDAYFTEPWVTRALLAAVEFAPGISALGGRRRCDATIWEPACGDGRMALQLIGAGYRVVASDIHDWGYGRTGVDFLAPGSDVLAGAAAPPISAIVTNPPFDQAVLFAGRALQLTLPGRGKVALLQRHEWDAARERHALFDTRPFAAKLVLHKRPRWSDAPDGASPRFPYAWYLWDWAHQGPPALRYLPDPDTIPAALGSLV